MIAGEGQVTLVPAHEGRSNSYVEEHFDFCLLYFPKDYPGQRCTAETHAWSTCSVWAPISMHCYCSLGLLGPGRGARKDRCLRLRKLFSCQKLRLEKFLQLAKFVDETAATTAAVPFLVAAVGTLFCRRFWQHFASFVWQLGHDVTILNGHLLKFGKVGVRIDASRRRGEQFVCVCWRLVDIGDVGVSLNGAWIIEVPAHERINGAAEEITTVSSATCW